MDMHTLALERPLAFFDLETTGLNVCKDRIVEISILKLMPDGNILAKTRRVNPTVPIPADTTAIHGITDAEVKDEPTFKRLAAGIRDFLEDCDLAGYNMVKFDLPMLIEEFDRAGIDFEYEDRRLVDAQRIFFTKEPRSLEAALRYYTGTGMETLGRAHTAEADTLATFRLFLAQLDKYDDEDCEPHLKVERDVRSLHQNFGRQHVDLAGHIHRNGQGLPIIAFGKYKGELVTAVFKKEPGYYDWMMSREFPIDTKRHITRIRLEMKMA